MKNQILINQMEDLLVWLESNKIPFQSWGQQSTKSVNNLFDEIISGDCFLVKDKPLRVLSVVQVLICQNKLVLVEKEQLFCDNRVRIRLIPPSEKMKENESWENATFRCLEEELELNPEEIQILTKEIKPKIRNRFSSSYPGLRSRYHLYQVLVSVKELPATDFWTYEKNTHSTDRLIEKHKWGWVNPDLIQFNPEKSLCDSE